jgi:nitrate reductase beta subunit
MWLIDLRIIAAKPLVSSQVIVGTIAFLGLIIYTLLVLMEAKSAKGKELRSHRLLYLSNLYIRDDLVDNSAWN